MLSGSVPKSNIAWKVDGGLKPLTCSTIEVITIEKTSATTAATIVRTQERANSS